MYRNQKEFERWGRFYFDGDGGGGSGLTPDEKAAFDNRLKKLEGKNDNAVVALAEELYKENFQLRDRNRKLTDNQIPEGGIALTAEQKAAWEGYQALGKPEEIKQGLDQRTQFQGELEKAKRTEQLRTVASAAGYNYEVLADVDELARARGKALTYEVRDLLQQDGSKKPTPFVKDGTTEKPLTEYADSEWKNHLAALKTQGGQQQQQQQSSGTRFLQQHSSTTGGNQTDLVAQQIADNQKRAAEAPNPLLPKK